MAAAPAKDSVVPFAAFLVFTCALLLAPQAALPGVGRVRIALLIGAFAIVAHAWTRFAAGRPLMQYTQETWLVGALLGWALFMFPLSLSPSASARMLLDEYLKAVGVFWLITNTVNTLGRLRAVAWTLSLATVPLAATGVWHFLSHREFVPGRIVGYDSPLTVNPNDLALMLDLILPLTVALFIVSRRPGVRTFLAGLIVLDTCAIVVTFSRGGFLALAAILILYLRTLHEWRQRRWAVAALVLAVAAVPFLPSGYLDRLGTITNIQSDKTYSAQLRWADTRIALALTWDHALVGAGIQGNVLALNEFYASRFQRVRNMIVHNVYLVYAMDLGWPGLGLFLLLLVSCIRNAARIRERCIALPALQELSALAEGIRLTLVAFAVAGLFYPDAYNVYPYYFTGLAVALRAAYTEEARNLPRAVRLATADRVTAE
jgi:putative inorganic carbon (hco3(-)) transporter